MKTLFIPLKLKSVINKEKILEISENLPKSIAIVYSIQYQDIASQIKEILLKNHDITGFMQVLGCTKPNFIKSTQAILLIGEARFHALSLAVNSNLPIYILENNQLVKLPDEETESSKSRKRASYLNFLNSEKTGVLISLKPGQQNLKKAITFKKKLKNKKAYLFIGDNLNIDEFENFPEIQSWINTACPRLDMNHKKIINAEDIKL